MLTKQEKTTMTKKNYCAVTGLLARIYNGEEFIEIHVIPDRHGIRLTLNDQNLEPLGSIIIDHYEEATKAITYMGDDENNPIANVELHGHPRN